MVQNCWEYMNCGRERGSSDEICPALTETMAHKMNRGSNAGRVCWAVPGTRCHGKVQGTYAEKVLLCSECDFRKRVQEEEGRSFRLVYLRN